MVLLSSFLFGFYLQPLKFTQIQMLIWNSKKDLKSLFLPQGGAISFSNQTGLWMFTLLPADRQIPILVIGYSSGSFMKKLMFIELLVISKQQSIHGK